MDGSGRPAVRSPRHFMVLFSGVRKFLRLECRRRALSLLCLARCFVRLCFVLHVVVHALALYCTLSCTLSCTPWLCLARCLARYLCCVFALFCALSCAPLRVVLHAWDLSCALSCTSLFAFALPLLCLPRCFALLCLVLRVVLRASSLF